MGLEVFQQRLSQWGSLLESKRPLLTPLAREQFIRLGEMLESAERQVFGVHRIMSSNPEDHPDPSGTIDEMTSLEIERLERLIRHNFDKMIKGR